MVAESAYLLTFSGIGGGKAYAVTEMCGAMMMCGGQDTDFWWKVFVAERRVWREGYGLLNGVLHIRKRVWRNGFRICGKGVVRHKITYYRFVANLDFKRLFFKAL